MMAAKGIRHELDIEALQLAVILAVLGMPLLKHPWAIYAAVAIAALPQGRLLTRALHDRPRDGKPVFRYLIVNELAVVALATVYAIAWWAVHG